MSLGEEEFEVEGVTIDIIDINKPPDLLEREADYCVRHAALWEEAIELYQESTPYMQDHAAINIITSTMRSQSNGLNIRAKSLRALAELRRTAAREGGQQ